MSNLPSAAPVTENENHCDRIEGIDLGRVFSSRRHLFQRRSDKIVLANISLQLSQSRIIGLVGESGEGKTTLARILAGLLPPTSGKVLFNSQPMTEPKTFALVRERVRMIFQNVNAPLNPRMRIETILDEPLKLRTKLNKRERKEHLAAVSNDVGLPAALLSKYPQALSGGEKRRVSIARALMCKPSFLFADEPTSGLDPELRSNILELFSALARNQQVGILLITHDMDAAEHICDEIMTLNKGTFQNTHEHEIRS